MCASGGIVLRTNVAAGRDLTGSEDPDRHTATVVVPEWHCEAIAAGVAAGIRKVWQRNHMPDRIIHASGWSE